MNTLVTAVLCAVFLAPACALFGGLAQHAKLPQITGYLVAGIAVGPHVLNLLDDSAVDRLWIVDQVCLSVIALAAGAELHWEQLDKLKKQVAMITLGISGFTWGLVCALLVALAPYISSFLTMTSYQVVAVCSLAATLMVARSPASAIAVLQDTAGKGPFCALVMAVVIVKDILTIVTFSVNIEVARALFSASGEAPTLAALGEPFVSVALAFGLGVVGSLVLTGGSRTVGRVSGLLGARATPVLRGAAVIAIATAVFEAASFFDAEPLLSCAVTGLLATNMLKDGERDAFHAVLNGVMPRVNLAFFSLAGASLHLESLLETVWLAGLIAAVRLLGIYLGSHAGCLLSQSALEHRRRMWRAMVTQAGVALGLARMVAVRFPTWGPYFQTLMASVILFNLLLGPPLFRQAIVSVGESKHFASHKADDATPDGRSNGESAPRGEDAIV